MIIRRFFSVFLVSLFLFFSSFGAAIDVLLCPYDTGDSNIMRRVVSQLKQEGKSFTIAGFGRGSEVFGKEKEFFLLEGGSKENRKQVLPESSIKALQEKFKPKSVLSGMASVGQAQVLNAFKGRAKTIAVYDNFDGPKGKEFIQPFMQKVGEISMYMIPAT